MTLVAPDEGVSGNAEKKRMVRRGRSWLRVLLCDGLGAGDGPKELVPAGHAGQVVIRIRPHTDGTCRERAATRFFLARA